MRRVAPQLSGSDAPSPAGDTMDRIFFLISTLYPPAFMSLSNAVAHSRARQGASS
jgi:hypothetical protein